VVPKIEEDAQVEEVEVYESFKPRPLTGVGYASDSEIEEEGAHKPQALLTRPITKLDYDSDLEDNKGKEIKEIYSGEEGLNKNEKTPLKDNSVKISSLYYKEESEEEKVDYEAPPDSRNETTQQLLTIDLDKIPPSVEPSH
jgi:hypothetical protein